MFEGIKQTYNNYHCMKVFSMQQYNPSTEKRPHWVDKGAVAQIMKVQDEKKTLCSFEALKNVRACVRRYQTKVYSYHYMKVFSIQQQYL